MVIAIIGILASIVLVSFPGAQKKARDSRVISAIAQARTVMTYVKANDGSYANFSNVTPAAEMVPINNEVKDNDLNKADLTVIKNSDSSEACMYAPLQSSGYYCADSTGVSGSTLTNPNSAGNCPDGGATAKCPSDIK